MTKWSSRTYKQNQKDIEAGIISPFKTEGGRVQKLNIQDDSGALITIDSEHASVHNGEAFHVHSYADLAINHVLDLTMQIPDTSERVHWRWAIETESETNWWVYEDAVIVNPLSGTFTPLNCDRNSSKTADVILKYEDQANLAAANADTNISGATTISSGISGAGKDSGDALSGAGIILKQGAIYCLRAEAASAGYINFYMFWVGEEH